MGLLNKVFGKKRDKAPAKATKKPRSSKTAKNRTETAPRPKKEKVEIPAESAVASVTVEPDIEKEAQELFEDENMTEDEPGEDVAEEEPVEEEEEEEGCKYPTSKDDLRSLA